MADRNSVLKLKAPYRDGPMHLVTTPLKFMRRLAALAQQQLFGTYAASPAWRRHRVGRTGIKVNMAHAPDDAPSGSSGQFGQVAGCFGYVRVGRVRSTKSLLLLIAKPSVDRLRAFRLAQSKNPDTIRV